MKLSKRPWTRAEKWLLTSPLLLAAMTGGVWLWRRQVPVSFEVSNASSFQALQFSPDGSQLAVMFNDTNSSVFSGRIYDAATGSKLCDLAVPPPSTSGPFRGGPWMDWPAWSPDGTKIVAGYSDDSRGTTKIADRAVGRKKKLGFHFNYIGKIALWDARSGSLRGNFLYAPRSEDSRSKVSFSGDGKTLIGYGSPLSTFDAATGRRLSVTRATFETFALFNLNKLNEKLSLLAEGDEDGTHFHVLDTRTKRVVWEPHLDRIIDFQWCGEILGVRTFAPSLPKGKPQIANALLLWNAKTRSLLPSPPISGRLYQMFFSPDGNTLSYLEGDFNTVVRPGQPQHGDLTIWNPRLHRVMWRFPLMARLSWIEWSPDGNRLACIENGTDASPTRLLVFDRAGNRLIDQKTSAQMTRWSPDSIRLSVASPVFQAAGKIEIFRIAK